MLRCQHLASVYSGERCLAHAAGRLIAPDGYAGSYYCREHGERIVEEFREKVREEWRLEAPALCEHVNPDDPKTWDRWHTVTRRACCDACMDAGFLAPPVEG